MNYKFNIGDKVKIKGDLKERDYYYMDGSPIDVFFAPEMSDHLGEEAIVTGYRFDSYNFDIDDGEWQWVDGMLEDAKVEDEKITTPTPKKLKQPQLSVVIQDSQYLLHSTYTYSDGVIDFDSEVVQSDSMRIIFNDTTTIVILSDGSKGVAKLSPDDTYDQQKGIDIAVIKASIKSLQKQLKKLVK